MFMDWLLSFPSRKTATQEIMDVLGGFTSAVARLDAAIDQGDAELDESMDRVDDARDQFLAIRQTEFIEQLKVAAALDKAVTVRNNIAALLGEPV